MAKNMQAQTCTFEENIFSRKKPIKKLHIFMNYTSTDEMKMTKEQHECQRHLIEHSKKDTLPPTSDDSTSLMTFFRQSLTAVHKIKFSSTLKIP
jgi:hypothetical protein